MAKLKKQKQPENPGKETMGLFLQYSVTILCVLLVTILPLAMKNGFYQIGDFKFQVYKVIMIGGIVLITPMLLLYAFFCRKEFHLKECIKSFSVTDWFVLAYMISTLISYFANPKYMKDNFWGYPGWYMGLFAQFTFVFLYFIISRFGKDYVVILSFFAGTSFITYVLGILNRLLIDPLGVYKGLDPKYYYFLSTIGQSSWYAGFLAVFLPFGMGLFIVTEKKYIRILSGVFCFIGFMTAVSQNSDSTYLALGAIFLILLYVAVSSGNWMNRFCFLLCAFFLGAKFMRLLTYLHPNEYLTMPGTTTELDKISMFLVFNKKSWVVVLLALLLWAFSAYLLKKGTYNKNVMSIVRNIIYVLTLALLVLAILILVLGAKNLIPSPINDKIRTIPYMVWWENWGNGRGFTWTASVKMICEFPLLKLLFGVGPDGFSRYSYEFYQELISSKWGTDVLTNAHNEWLTMVIDGGILGAIVYLSIFLSAMIRGVKKTMAIPWAIAISACIASYCSNNFIDYQNVTCTPFIFILLGIFGWVTRPETDSC